MSLYLIKKGPQPEYHKAPYHPVIICDYKPLAKWEAGWTGDEYWVWEKDNDPHTGWLLVRWRGLDIDYGHLVRSHTLIDGTKIAIVHDRDKEPWTLINGAVWFSTRHLPFWLTDKGAIYPPDDFTQDRILDTYRFLNANKKNYVELMEKRFEEAIYFWPKTNFIKNLSAATLKD